MGSLMNNEVNSNTNVDVQTNQPQPTVAPVQPQPAPQPKVVFEQPQPTNVIPAKYKPIGAWGYVLYELLFSIPLVGFIFLLVFSLGGTKNENLKNFARSFLCWLLIFLVIGIIVGLIFVVLIVLAGGLAGAGVSTTA